MTLVHLKAVMMATMAADRYSSDGMVRKKKGKVSLLLSDRDDDEKDICLRKKSPLTSKPK